MKIIDTPNPRHFSNCCNAVIYEETDVCSNCEEHCEASIECPDCEGSGMVDILDVENVREWTITPPYKTVTCEDCNGEEKIGREIEL